MIYKQVHCKAFSITSRLHPDYIVDDDYEAKCRINYCWTKLCLFLDVRSEDHRSRSPCTRNSWRDSVPATKAVLSRVRFPQLSVQVSVQSENTAFAGKTYRHKCTRCTMQMSYLYASDFPFKNFCTLNMQKQ